MAIAEFADREDVGSDGSSNEVCFWIGTPTCNAWKRGYRSHARSLACHAVPAPSSALTRPESRMRAGGHCPSAGVVPYKNDGDHFWGPEDRRTLPLPGSDPDPPRFTTDALAGHHQHQL